MSFVRKVFFTILCVCANFLFAQSPPKNIIYLSLDEVIGISRLENLSLKSKALELESQNLEEWKALSFFLPSLNYQGFYTNNLELPVFVFMGQEFTVGTKFTFQHSLDLTLPLFTGGSRLFNYNIQKSLKKSLSEELKGKEQEIVIQAMQAYYGIILSHQLLKTSQEAAAAAKENLDQVNKFYSVGSATELDLQRAKAQYASALPSLEKAKSELFLSAQRLKYLLNIPFEDSLIVTDSLNTKDFLREFKSSGIAELIELSKENRSDLKSLAYKLEAAEQGENIALGSFAPSIAVSANLAHQAQLENSNVRWDDYIRSKSITLSMIWPLFEGGRKILSYQQAKIQSDQMKLMFELADKGRVLNVEESYFNNKEAVKNLESLKEAMLHAKESYRLSKLLYAEGMATQLDVLNAQLLNTQSNMQYYQGVFNYNVSQLNLLASIGLLQKIWE